MSLSHMMRAIPLGLALMACGGGEDETVTTLDVEGEEVVATVETPLTPADRGTVGFKPAAGLGFLCGLASNKPIVFIVTGPDGGECTVNAETKDCTKADDGTCKCSYEIKSVSGDCTDNGRTDSYSP